MTDQSWFDRAQDSLRRHAEHEREQVAARRRSREEGRLTGSLQNQLRKCNPLQLKAALNLCRQFLQEHRNPPEGRHCRRNGRIAVHTFNTGSVRYELQSSPCGKPTCKKCPHGPYLYGYHRDGEIIKVTYFGAPSDYKNKPPRNVAIAVAKYLRTGKTVGNSESGESAVPKR